MTSSSSPAVKTAVLPVAGLGTRFLPVTKAVPKELLPLADRPCLEYIVAEAVAAGIERVVLVSGPGKQAMVDYFHPSPELERHLAAKGKHELLEAVTRAGNMAEVVVVRQRETLGLGHAVLTAAPAVGDEPFCVLLGDEVIDTDGVPEGPAIGQLIEALPTADHAVVALIEVPPDQVSRYGICAGERIDEVTMSVSAMVEKPPVGEAPSNMAIVGRYVLPARIFEILRTTPRGRGGEIQLTDAIAVLAAEGKVHGRRFAGERFDTGNVLGLLQASMHYTWKRPELKSGVEQLARDLLSRSGRA